MNTDERFSQETIPWSISSMKAVSVWVMITLLLSDTHFVHLNMYKKKTNIQLDKEFCQVSLSVFNSNQSQSQWLMPFQTVPVNATACNLTNLSFSPPKLDHSFLSFQIITAPSFVTVTMQTCNMNVSCLPTKITAKDRHIVHSCSTWRQGRIINNLVSRRNKGNSWKTSLRQRLLWPHVWSFLKESIKVLWTEMFPNFVLSVDWFQAAALCKRIVH